MTGRRAPWVTVTAAVLAALLLATITYLIGRQDRAASSSAAAKPSVVDVGFAQDMATHHDQAVLMANMAITKGSGAVRGMADQILTGQSQEVGQLRGWLESWNEPIADPSPMSWMPMPAQRGMPGSAMSASRMSAPRMQTPAVPMPGMATATQMSQLYGASGKRFDVLFLQLMIRHHQGGIEMAHYAELHASLAAVRAAATAMRVEQVQDIAVMQALLASDGGTELPAP